jgi:hypothetical protein
MLGRNLGQRAGGAKHSLTGHRSVLPSANPAAAAALHGPVKIIRPVERAWTGINKNQAQRVRPIDQRAIARVTRTLAKLRRNDKAICGNAMQKTTL